MKIRDYAYIKGISRDYGIGKITQLNSGYSSNGGELIDIQFKHSKHSIPKKDIISSPNIGKLLKVGDFIDNHCITKIKGTTIYTNDGWFIDVDDVEDLVTSIVTKEQFKQLEYKIK